MKRLISSSFFLGCILIASGGLVEDRHITEAGHFTAPPDPACESLDVKPPDLSAVLAAEGAWDMPIPRVVRQVWVGPREIRPPMFEGEYVDFDRLVPMRGLVLAPEPGGRDIGSGDSILWRRQGTPSWEI